MHSKKIRHFVDGVEQECQRLLEEEENTDGIEEVEGGDAVVINNANELCTLSEEEHRITFQSYYKEENSDSCLY
eukprot:13763691-Ditylum_brightwellii.AAC.1